MRTIKTLIAAGALLAAAGIGIRYASATETWSTPAGVGPKYEPRLGTATTPDESSAPRLATDGFNLENGKVYQVTVIAQSFPATWYPAGDAAVPGYVLDGGCVLGAFDGGCKYPRPAVKADDADAAFFDFVPPPTAFGGCQLQAWIYNPASLSWARNPTWDLFVTQGSSAQNFTIGAPPPSVGRIAYQPIGCMVPPRIYVGAI